MLVAKRTDGRLFSILDYPDRRELEDIRGREWFFCPVCDARLQMRLGRKRSWHFAHRERTRCAFESEPESSYHLRGKEQLVRWLQAQGAEVVLEPYLARLKQRPDLLLHTTPANTALEFQCATIDPGLLYARTRTFQKAGIIPSWLLGGNRLKRTGACTFQISQMDWLTLRSARQGGSSTFLLYFCPESSLFATLTDVIPYSAGKAIARLHYHPMSSFSMHQLYRTEVTDNFPSWEAWRNLKQRWRRHAYRYRGRTHRYLQQHFGPLSSFPPAAGLPTPYLYTIETPCFLWQSWLFYQFYLFWPKQQLIRREEVFSAFRTLVHQGIFTTRKLPLIHIDETSALDAYLHALVRFGFLCEVKRGVFRKAVEKGVPQTTEELKKEDAAYFAKLFEIP